MSVPRETLLPTATYSPRIKNVGSLSYRDRRNAAHALALTAGAGMVIVNRAGSPHAKRRAAKTAKAFNQMIDAAIDRHEAFWRDYDGDQR